MKLETSIEVKEFRTDPDTGLLRAFWDEFAILYTIEGRYHPATYEYPEEFPEITVLKITNLETKEEVPYSYIFGGIRGKQHILDFEAKAIKEFESHRYDGEDY